jgi:hypothetical protein
MAAMPLLLKASSMAGIKSPTTATMSAPQPSMASAAGFAPDGS